jgi:hypothetical protein
MHVGGRSVSEDGDAGLKADVFKENSLSVPGGYDFIRGV